jgi:hypothetical protein
MEWMTPWIAVGATGGLALLVGVVLRIRSRRKSAVERERERRLAVNATGRLTDGVLVESDCPEEIDPAGRDGLLFYRYKARGIEYSAAQDISALLPLTPPKVCSPGIPVQVKYNPQRPSDSIILCEQWSGLPTAGERESAIR